MHTIYILSPGNTLPLLHTFVATLQCHAPNLHDDKPISHRHHLDRTLRSFAVPVSQRCPVLLESRMVGFRWQMLNENKPAFFSLYDRRYTFPRPGSSLMAAALTQNPKPHSPATDDHTNDLDTETFLFPIRSRAVTLDGRIRFSRSDG